jgi:hypothetical protein
MAKHLLFALGYEHRDAVFFRAMRPHDFLFRIKAVRRQLALGRGREFTSTDLDERQMLGQLAELEKVTEQAREGGSIVIFGDA